MSVHPSDPASTPPDATTTTTPVGTAENAPAPSPAEPNTTTCLARAVDYVNVVLPRLPPAAHEHPVAVPEPPTWDIATASDGKLHVTTAVAPGGPTPDLFAFLTEHIACVVQAIDAVGDAAAKTANTSSVENADSASQRRGVVLSLHVAEIVTAKNADKAVWIVKDRLYWRQYRSAVLLLRVFRQKIPSKYWGPASVNEVMRVRSSAKSTHSIQ